jgi:hypothetical protein
VNRPCLVEPSAVIGVERPSEPVLGVVGHLQPFFKALHLDDRQHRPEDLFLPMAASGATSAITVGSRK